MSVSKRWIEWGQDVRQAMETESNDGRAPPELCSQQESEADERPVYFRTRKSWHLDRAYAPALRMVNVWAPGQNKLPHQTKEPSRQLAGRHQ